MNRQEVASRFISSELWNGSGGFLTEKERINWAKALLVCANADGNLAAQEKDWILGCAVAGGVSDAGLQELENYQANESISDVIKADKNLAQSGMAVIYDAIKACSADGILHAEEYATIIKAASLLGVSETTVQHIQTAFELEKIAKQNRLNIVFPEGDPYHLA